MYYESFIFKKIIFILFLIPSFDIFSDQTKIPYIFMQCSILDERVNEDFLALYDMMFTILKLDDSSSDEIFYDRIRLYRSIDKSNNLKWYDFPKRSKISDMMDHQNELIDKMITKMNYKFKTDIQKKYPVIEEFYIQSSNSIDNPVDINKWIDRYELNHRLLVYLEVLNLIDRLSNVVSCNCNCEKEKEEIKVISLKNIIFMDNTDDLKNISAANIIFNDVAKILNQNKKYVVYIRGFMNADLKPSSDKLPEKRAIKIQKILVENYKISNNQIRIVGIGSISSDKKIIDMSITKNKMMENNISEVESNNRHVELEIVEEK